MNSSSRTFSFLFVAFLVLASAPARAAWQPPKDNVLTDGQVTSYLQILKSAIEDAQAAGKSINNNPSPAAAIALVQANDTKFKANLASHNMSDEEYRWVGERLMEAWGATITSKVVSDATANVVEQRKKSQQAIDDLKANLAAYQKAQAAGRRVMSKDERQSAIDSAKSDQQSALDEARQHEDEIKQYSADAAKGDSDAKAADALAQNPPPDVSADDRQSYVDGKKTEAQSARDAAKEAREKLQEAQKARAESLAKADAAKKKMADPDLPTTDDEKAQVKKDNEDMIASLNTQLASAQQNLAQMDQMMAQFTKSMQDQQAKNPVPPQNLDLFKKHQADFNAVWGIKAGS